MYSHNPESTNAYLLGNLITSFMSGSLVSAIIKAIYDTAIVIKFDKPSPEMPISYFQTNHQQVRIRVGATINEL